MLRPRAVPAGGGNRVEPTLGHGAGGKVAFDSFAGIEGHAPHRFPVVVKPEDGLGVTAEVVWRHAFAGGLIH